MTSLRVCVAAMAMVVAGQLTASAQFFVPPLPIPVVAARPVIAPVAPVRYTASFYAARPAVAVQPIVSVQPVASVQPVTSYRPVTTIQPVTSYRPVTSYPPVTSYRPVALAAPVTAYRPAVVPVVPVAPVYAAPAIIRPKVYFPGQPVRNTLRAISP